MRWRGSSFVLAGILLAAMLTACDIAGPGATPTTVVVYIVVTATPAPVTPTSVPPTAVPVPPTFTPVPQPPTQTPVPPTEPPTVPPTPLPTSTPQPSFGDTVEFDGWRISLAKILSPSKTIDWSNVG